MANSKNILFLVLANLFWAGNFIFGHMVVAEISPLQLTWARWLIALVALIPLALIVDKGAWKSALKEWPLHLLLALLGVIGFNLLSYVALQHTTAVDVALVGAINPASIAIVAAIIMRERLRGMSILGFIVSLGGVALVLTNGRLGEIFTMDYNVGQLFMLGAVAAWTLFSVLGRKLTSPPVTSTMIQAIMAVVLLTPFVLATDTDFTMSGGAWTGLLYIAFFPSVLSFMFWNIAVRRIGAARSGIFLNLLPVFTVLLSLALGGPLSIIQLIGGAVVIAGVTITVRPPKQAIN